MPIQRTLSARKDSPVPAGFIAASSYRLVAASDPLVNTRIDGRYLVLARLGEGAMSTVYKAVHEAVDRVVAVKVLKKGLSVDPAAFKRFQREAKAVSVLRHPNLITVHDFGTMESGQPYQVIEYLEGRSLAAAIASDGALPPERAARVFIQVCDAMQHAHNQGIIHRDLKPENIMLVKKEDQDDAVKVVDFGIVKLTDQSQMISQRLTKTGEVWGSPLYVSPEQCMGQELDHRSDIYSLGTVMYEALTGRPAFSGKNLGQIVLKHVKEMPAPFREAAPHLEIPLSLETLVFTALAKDPARRFQTMEELRDALAAAVPGVAALPSGARRSGSSSRISGSIPISFAPGDTGGREGAAAGGRSSGIRRPSGEIGAQRASSSISRGGIPIPGPARSSAAAGLPRWAMAALAAALVLALSGMAVYFLGGKRASVAPDGAAVQPQTPAAIPNRERQPAGARPPAPATKPARRSAASGNAAASNSARPARKASPSRSANAVPVSRPAKTAPASEPQAQEAVEPLRPSQPDEMGQWLKFRGGN